MNAVSATEGVSMQNVEGRAGKRRDGHTPGRVAGARRALAVVSTVLTAAALTLVGSALPAAAAGSTWYVDQTDGADGANCGAATGSGACATIGAALARAADGDTVSVASGTYSEALTLSHAITLQGDSQAGVVLNNPSTDDVPTITIDADGPVTVARMTITPAEPSDSVQNTVAVRAQAGSTATVSQITVSNPTSLAVGGIHAAGGSTLSLDRSTLTGLAFGVAVGNLPGDGTSVPATATVTDSTITNNNAGVLLAAGTATITGGSVSGNTFAGLAGSTSDAAFQVTDTSITDNGSPANGSGAGVLLQSGGSFTGGNVTISGNYDGVLAEGDVTLTSSTVTNNGGSTQDGTPYGGGILVQPRTDPDTGDPIPLAVSITGTDVSGNTFGVQLPYTQATITGSTITNNAMFGITAQGSDAQHPGTLALTGSTVKDNGPQSGTSAVASQNLGGLSLADVDATVTGTSFTGNTIGVMSTRSSTVTINGGAVADNPLGGVFAGQGVGTLPSIDLADVSITGNGLATSAAFPFAAGITVTAGTVTGRGLAISGNSNGVLASANGADATLTLTDSVVSGNVITEQEVLPGGNGILAGGSGEAAALVTLRRTEVSGNAGNGLWMPVGGVGRVTDSTIAGNSGDGISGVLPEGGEPGDGPATSLLLAGSTVADNAGGAVVFGNGLAVTAGGTILAAPGGTPVCAGDVSTLTDGGYNLASDDSCALTADTSAVADPLLGALADNNGPTRTMLPGPTSPAINAIPTGTSVGDGDQAVALCGNGTVDQRGTTRPQGSACDIGAVERTSGLITVTASDATLYRGGTPPTVTASYTGFAGTDTVADLNTPASCGFDESAGTTSCHGAADDFYDFSYVPGVLTVLDKPSITTTTLPDGQVDATYSASLAATGGAAPLTFSLTGGQLPPGLTLHSEGTITGSPTAGGPYQFTITASDANAVTDQQQLTITITAPACSTAPFPDVPVDDPNCPAIDWTADRGIATGYTDTYYHPERSVTRQTMAAFLYRMEHDGDSAPDCTAAPFDDVPVDNTFCGAIAWLKDQGVTSGYADGTFHPTQAVTNQTMAAFLYRLDHGGDAAPDCTAAPFDDVPVTSTFCGAIAWISDAGIATGSDGGFGPATVVTRGSMAATLYLYDGYQDAHRPR